MRMSPVVLDTEGIFANHLDPLSGDQSNSFTTTALVNRFGVDPGDVMP